MPADESLLAQGIVDFRNEERRAAAGAYGTPAAPRPLCPTCLLEVDPDGYCNCCGRVVRP